MMAMTILQDWLDDVSDKLMAGDAEGWYAAFALPVTVRSDAGELQIVTRDQLEDKFRSWRQTVAQLRVIDLGRTARRAVFVETDLIAGHYETLMLTDRGPAMDRFNSAITLVRTARGAWLCREVSTGLPAVEKHLFYTPPRTDDAGTDRKDET